MLLAVAIVFVIGVISYLLKSRTDLASGVEVVDANLQKQAQGALKLGLRLLQDGKLEESIKYFEKVANIESTLREKSRYFLALVALETGGVDTATSLIEELEFTDLDLDECYDLADHLERRGKFETAKNIFERIYLTEIGFKDVVTRLQKLREHLAQFSQTEIGDIIARRIVDSRWTRADPSPRAGRAVPRGPCRSRATSSPPTRSGPAPWPPPI